MWAGKICDCGHKQEKHYNPEFFKSSKCWFDRHLLKRCECQKFEQSFTSVMIQHRKKNKRKEWQLTVKEWKEKNDRIHRSSNRQDLQTTHEEGEEISKVKSQED